MRPTPVGRVLEELAKEIPPATLARLPRRYFRIGDVLILDGPLAGPESRVAQAYANALGKRIVLGREGGIEGEFREPRMRQLWGGGGTETTHIEAGVKYRLDAAKVMWSQGNLAERQRVGRWDCAGQTVVDLFAGIGYFALPIAAKTGAERVIAIEKNPIAHRFLVENIRLNGLTANMEARRGDCRAVAPQGVADRVLLGLLPDSIGFIDAALGALKPHGGVLHVHRVVAARATRDEAFAPVEAAVRRLGGAARLRHFQPVKSYGPARSHVVLDVDVNR